MGNMTIIEAIKSRHSVRAYNDELINDTTSNLLKGYIDECNAQSGMNFQLILNEPNAFDCFLSHYGKFSGVKNYIALVGDKSKSTYESIGYYGEKIVLYAQTLGLNTCWVALTYKKTDAVAIKCGQKIHAVIAIGYGENQGKQRKSKSLAEVCEGIDHPDWFIRGVEGALLAPTAINQQKFYFARNGNVVKIKARLGPYSKMDLGIVKLHFEICAGIENFVWEV